MVKFIQASKMTKMHQTKHLKTAKSNISYSRSNCNKNKKQLTKTGQIFLDIETLEVDSRQNLFIQSKKIANQKRASTSKLSHCPIFNSMSLADLDTDIGPDLRNNLDLHLDLEDKGQCWVHACCYY